MSSKKEPNHDSEHEFLERVLRYQEKSITPDELVQLNEDLRNHPERLAEFTRICETSRLIHEGAVVPAKKNPKARSGLRPLIARWGWVEHVGVAALLILCLGLGGLFLLRNSGENPWGDAVAKLEFCSEDAAFSEIHEMPGAEGSMLGKGWVYLERGTVRILFRSGASVELVGTTALGIASPMRTYLEYGKASVYAPESARDFVVATEGVEIVDLGTRFEVEVDPESRESKVAVAEGLVDLHLGSPGTPRRIQPLEAGWQAQVDDSGEIVNLEKSPDYQPVPNATTKSPLLAHWKLDELGPGGVLTDSSKRELDGVFLPGSAGGHRRGVNGEALGFGSDGYVDLSEHLSLFSQLDVFTFSAWIRHSGKNVGIIFSLSDGTANNRVQFNLNSRNLTYLWQHQSPHWDSVPGRVDGWNLGQWYHVAVSVDRSGVRLYRDGQLIGSGSVGRQIGTAFQTLAGVDKPTRAYLGHINQGSAGPYLRPQWFSGIMDDVQIYTDALDSAEIKFLYDHPGEEWSPSVTR